MLCHGNYIGIRLIRRPHYVLRRMPNDAMVCPPKISIDILHHPTYNPTMDKNIQHKRKHRQQAKPVPTPHDAALLPTMRNPKDFLFLLAFKQAGQETPEPASLAYRQIRERAKPVPATCKPPPDRARPNLCNSGREDTVLFILVLGALILSGYYAFFY